MIRINRPVSHFPLALLLLAGCGEELPAIRYRTEQAFIGTSFDLPLCEGDLAFVDSEIVRLEGLLGAPDAGRIEIYLYDRPPPQCRFVGCFVDERYIATLWEFLDHELVHAVIAKFARPNDFWNEAAAESLRLRRTQRGATTPSENRGKDDDDLEYATVGHFGRWLLLEHGGVENIREVLTGADFEEVYGFSFDEASADYETTAPWSYPAPNPCSEPRLESNGAGGYRDFVSINCQSEDTSQFIGPGVARTFEIETAGSYELTINGGLGVRLLGCQTEILWAPPGPNEQADVMNEADSHQLPVARLFRAEESPHTLELQPGSYRMTLISDRETGEEQTMIEVSLASSN